MKIIHLLHIAYFCASSAKKVEVEEKRMNFRPNHGSNLARVKSKSIRRKSRAATEWRYLFNYDCHHSSQGNTHTDHTIHFRFKDVNGVQIGSISKTIPSSECGYHSGYQTVEIQTESQLDFAYVELETYGGDAFLIDQAVINIYDDTDPGGVGAQWHGRGSRRFGVNNAGYWCLSTDRPDYGGKCGYKLQFYFKDVGRCNAGSCWRWRTN